MGLWGVEFSIYNFFLRCKHNKIFRLYGRLNGKRYIYIRTGDFVICLGGYVGDLNKNTFFYQPLFLFLIYLYKCLRLIQSNLNGDCMKHIRVESNDEPKENNA